jgi:hypothetical protein
MHGDMSRCTVTCHDARSHERKMSFRNFGICDCNFMNIYNLFFAWKFGSKPRVPNNWCYLSILALYYFHVKPTTFIMEHSIPPPSPSRSTVRHVCTISLKSENMVLFPFSYKSVEEMSQEGCTCTVCFVNTRFSQTLWRKVNLWTTMWRRLVMKQRKTVNDIFHQYTKLN